MTQPHRRSSSRQNWRTPPFVFQWAQSYQGRLFNLDAAADAENALCEKFFTDGDLNGLNQPWTESTWCNPPFNRTAEFIDKAIHEAEMGVSSCLLVTSATETKWYRRAVEAPGRMVVITGRLQFIHPEGGKPVGGNTVGSTLLFFRRARPATMYSEFTQPCYMNAQWVDRDVMSKMYNIALAFSHNLGK